KGTTAEQQRITNHAALIGVHVESLRKFPPRAILAAGCFFVMLSPYHARILATGYWLLATSQSRHLRPSRGAMVGADDQQVVRHPALVRRQQLHPLQRHQPNRNVA